MPVVEGWSGTVAVEWGHCCIPLVQCLGGVYHCSRAVVYQWGTAVTPVRRMCSPLITHNCTSLLYTLYLITVEFVHYYCMTVPYYCILCTSLLRICTSLLYDLYLTVHSYSMTVPQYIWLLYSCTSLLYKLLHLLDNVVLGVTTYIPSTACTIPVPLPV